MATHNLTTEEAKEVIERVMEEIEAAAAQVGTVAFALKSMPRREDLDLDDITFTLRHVRTVLQSAHNDLDAEILGT